MAKSRLQQFYNNSIAMCHWLQAGHKELAKSLLLKLVEYHGVKKVTNCLSRSAMVVLTVFIFSAPAPASIVKINKSGTIKNILVSGNDYELCADLVNNQKIEYRFQTSRPLVFNLHYHINEKVIYHVRNSLVVRRTGFYKATVSGEHCLMWSNMGKKSVSLEVSYKIQPIKK